MDADAGARVGLPWMQVGLLRLPVLLTLQAESQEGGTAACARHKVQSKRKTKKSKQQARPCVQRLRCELETKLFVLLQSVHP